MGKEQVIEGIFKDIQSGKYFGPEALDKAYEAGKMAGWRWISVKDQKPRIGQKVFFMETGSTGIHAGHMDDQGRWWCFAGGDQWPSKPHVWIPAPLPPAELAGPHEPPRPPNHFPVA